MLEPEQLLEAVVAQCTPKLLAGKKVMITAGATLEMIDPVRGITNLSSGKMGYAMARVAAHMGAAVTLVHGHSSLQLPTNVHCIAATDAESMYQSVMQHVGHQDIFIAVAAVADYSPTQTAPQKIKKNDALMTLHLKKNKDILAEVASLPNPPFCVGFAAETEHVIAYAEQKRIAKKLPLIVANQVGQAMGQDNNQVTLIDHTGTHPLPTLPKLKVAEHILRHVANMI
jgi:phosphopantothenoylcysteine decarboxylase/phosphopantothenate--cysteine ligase